MDVEKRAEVLRQIALFRFYSVVHWNSDTLERLDNAR